MPVATIACLPNSDAETISNQFLARAAVGSLLGTAVGDAITLTYEGMSRKRVRRFLNDRALKHRFLLGYGFCSDDTEHTCMVSQALLSAGSDHDADKFISNFRKNFAWRLRLWLLGLPAGIGLATLRSIIKLWLHPFSEGTGVFSAGNGPAMRSAIIGVCLGNRADLMQKVVSASTRLTHTDPRAEHGALAIAIAAWIASQRLETEAHKTFPDTFEKMIGPSANELSRLIRQASNSVANGEKTEQFAATIGCEKGVSGFVMHTVPVALHAWFRHEHNYSEAIEAVVRCGGDTDTVAAIVGGIVGASVGPEGIPEQWLKGVAEWPRSQAWIRSLGLRLALRFSSNTQEQPLPINVPMLFLRNLAFMVIVLLHGFRRLLPPY